MPSYSNKFQNLENKDVERWKNYATPPSIHFLLEWQNEQNCGATTQQSTLLKMEPKNRSSTADTYKFTYKSFKDGNVKDLIRFLDTCEEISNNKLLSTANSKFAFSRPCWLERHLKNGMTQYTTAPRSPKLAKTGPKRTCRAKRKKPSKSEGRLKIDALYSMHEFLRSGIEFPVNKGVLVKDWVKRLIVSSLP